MPNLNVTQAKPNITAEQFNSIKLADEKTKRANPVVVEEAEKQRQKSNNNVLVDALSNVVDTLASLFKGKETAPESTVAVAKNSPAPSRQETTAPVSADILSKIDSTVIKSLKNTTVEKSDSHVAAVMASKAKSEGKGRGE